MSSHAKTDTAIFPATNIPKLPAAMSLLRWFLVLTFAFLACSPPSVSTSNTTDYLALMSFKSHVSMDPSAALVNWGNLSVPMCQWPGVACGFKGRRLGRVVALNLARFNLVGTITTAMGNLTCLRLLDLSSNHFHGIIPPELGNLRDLETLILQENSIQGYIPPSLANCSHLVAIALDSNKLEGEIPSEFSLLHSLKQFYLGENRLTGKIPTSFGSLVSLKVLALEFNNLTGEIPTEIGNIVSLTHLSLGDNQLSATIPASLGNLSALTLLSIPKNELKGSIPPLQGLSSLAVLRLGANKLEGTIPPWLGNLSSLVSIDLQTNGLVGQIPESLGNLELLTVLSLSDNNLSGSIPHSIGNLHALNSLYLNLNELQGSLPNSIFNLSSLEVLEISYNNFTGVFPRDVGSKLPKLNTFSISYNQFHGVLPSSICNASMLQNIEIASTFLSGIIPKCLGAHQMNLSVVLLVNNDFEATNDADWAFMSGLTNCSNLRELGLDSNRLKGALPHSIANLSIGMEFLSIDENKITGKIPEGIGNLINLDILVMDQNILSGVIPSSLGKLKKLNLLDLSNNILSGTIPDTLGSLTQLSKLFLSGNHLSGPIPSSLKYCPLEVLDLSHNNLFGSIPKELFFISTLSNYMDLSHNSLSGTLPSEVGNLKTLNKIDFSNNMISNEIPDSISGCQSLLYLNLSKNIIQGIIPLSLGTLRGLFRLDLSYNNLSGTIPETLARLSGISSLDLSFNKFEGRVPKDGIFQNATVVLVAGNDGLCDGIPELKLTPCSNHTTKKSHHTVAIIVSICSGCVFLSLVFALFVLHQKSHNKKEINLQRSILNEQYVRISFIELVNATNGFAFENLIGAGSFGSVYKGKMIVNGQDVVVAVKVFNLLQRGASQSFVAECNTLRCARHRNLVKILTVCSSIDFQGRDFKALVYEFLPNGNLDQWLHQHTMEEEDGEHKSLEMITRLHIAIDVAASLDYLHQHKPTPIVHCDLKPSNVLLDCEMVARVGDFGLARFLHQDKDESSGWASMRGSIGYMAPEYGLGNEISTHGDVYSFGILLLEMLTGKRPTGNEFQGAIDLRNYAQMALPDRMSTIVDQQLLTETKDDEPSISNSSSVKGARNACIFSILQVGIYCSDQMPANRPSIGDALKELQAIRDKFLKHLRHEGVIIG